MPISIGTTAPSFTLKTKTATGLVDVNPVAEANGKNVLLIFFPAAFTGVCTEELCGLSSGFDAYKSLNAAVYGISTDSPFAQEAWAIQNKITITLLSDYAHKVVKAYDVELADLIGLGPSSSRAAVVIGKDGKIAYAEQTATVHDLPNFDAIKACLEKLG